MRSTECHFSLVTENEKSTQSAGLQLFMCSTKERVNEDELRRRAVTGTLHWCV